jgi:hypothetical protein
MNIELIAVSGIGGRVHKSWSKKETLLYNISKYNFSSKGMI